MQNVEYKPLYERQQRNCFTWEAVETAFQAIQASQAKYAWIAIQAKVE